MRERETIVLLDPCSYMYENCAKCKKPNDFFFISLPVYTFINNVYMGCMLSMSSFWQYMNYTSSKILHTGPLTVNCSLHPLSAGHRSPFKQKVAGILTGSPRFAPSRPISLFLYPPRWLNLTVILLLFSSPPTPHPPQSTV